MSKHDEIQQHLKENVATMEGREPSHFDLIGVCDRLNKVAEHHTEAISATMGQVVNNTEALVGLREQLGMLIVLMETLQKKESEEPTDQAEEKGGTDEK